MEVITVTGVIHLPLTWMVTLREMSHHGDTQKTDINTVLRPLLGMTGNWQACLCFISRPTIFAHSKLSPFFWVRHCSLWHCAQFYSSAFMTEPKDSCKGHKNSNDLVMYQSKCIIFCQETKQCYSIFFLPLIAVNTNSFFRHVWVTAVVPLTSRINDNRVQSLFVAVF